MNDCEHKLHKHLIPLDDGGPLACSLNVCEMCGTLIVVGSVRDKLEQHEGDLIAA